jgi:hypothetical protein
MHATTGEMTHRAQLHIDAGATMVKAWTDVLETSLSADIRALVFDAYRFGETFRDSQGAQDWRIVAGLARQELAKRPQ